MQRLTVTLHGGHTGAFRAGLRGVIAAGLVLKGDPRKENDKRGKIGANLSNLNYDLGKDYEMTTTMATRDERAHRRAASAERTTTTAVAAAKPKTTTAMTLDTGGGGLVTLDTEEIRGASGDTPLGTSVTAGLTTWL